MRNLSTLICVTTLALAVGGSGCKRKHDDAPTTINTVGASAVDQPVEAVDALTPPPPPRPPDFAAPPAQANTMNGHPNGPKQSDFEPMQGDAQRRVQTCLDAIPSGTALPGGIARLAIKYEVGNDGRPKDVAVTGDAPTDVLACGKSAVESVQFPKFEGTSVRNAFNLTYSRAQAPDLSTK